MLIHIDNIRKDILNDVILDLTQTAITQRAGKALTEQEIENISTLGLIVTECFAPIYYKLKKIQLTKPNFSARRVELSSIAYERFQTLIKKKLVKNDGLCMGMRYNKSTRVSDEIYCRIIGDIIES